MTVVLLIIICSKEPAVSVRVHILTYTIRCDCMQECASDFHTYHFSSPTYLLFPLFLQDTYFSQHIVRPQQLHLYECIFNLYCTR